MGTLATSWVRFLYLIGVMAYWPLVFFPERRAIPSALYQAARLLYVGFPPFLLGWWAYRRWAPRRATTPEPRAIEAWSTWTGFGTAVVVRLAFECLWRLPAWWADRYPQMTVESGHGLPFLWIGFLFEASYLACYFGLLFFLIKDGIRAAVEWSARSSASRRSA